MRKKISFVIATCFMAAMATMTAFGGQWIQDDKGWIYDQGNGDCVRNQWQWIDGNRDGIEECYFFDESGYCLISTVTADGYRVNENGAWVDGETVMTRAVEAKTEGANGDMILDMGAYTITLPKSWEGHYQVESGDRYSMKSIVYAPVREYPEVLFHITAYPSREEADEILSYVDSGIYLGEHGGLHYVIGTPTDTALGIYTPEDVERVALMRKDYPSILDSIKFK